MKTLFYVVFVCGLFGLSKSSAAAEERILSDDAWRADITTVARSIREIHPRPFESAGEDEFEGVYQALIDDVPTLSDKGIIVRLATLVGLVADGHTRLTFPRQHPDIGLEFGHSSTPKPSDEALEFKQLPLAFEKFADGVFVVAATADCASLIGHQLTEIGGMPVSEVLDVLQSVTFAENSQLEALMGADRISLIEVLTNTGISQSGDKVTFRLISPEGVVREETVDPLPPGPLEWIDAFASGPVPLREKHPELPFWYEYVSDGNYVYMQLDEITDADIPLAQFVTAVVQEAASKGAKLIVDVRNNFGGSGGLNKTLVMSIIQNSDLNHYDRTSVLTGRRTFSAAQMLVNELEQYTRVSLVGEPTGSRPDHFGDPKKIRLEHSGLTLRVSRLHWSSYEAFDDRESTYPDFLAIWTSEAYFSGSDPALALALSLKDISLKQLLRGALRRGDMQQIGRYTLDSKRSPQTFATDFAAELLELGDEFADNGELETASLAYQVGLFFYPDDNKLAQAVEGLGDTR